MEEPTHSAEPHAEVPRPGEPRDARDADADAGRAGADGDADPEDGETPLDAAAALLQDCLEAPAAERPQHLDARGASDPAVASEVGRLLARLRPHRRPNGGGGIAVESTVCWRTLRSRPSRRSRRGRSAASASSSSAAAAWAPSIWPSTSSSDGRSR